MAGGLKALWGFWSPVAGRLLVHQALGSRSCCPKGYMTRAQLSPGTLGNMIYESITYVYF